MKPWLCMKKVVFQLLCNNFSHSSGLGKTTCKKYAYEYHGMYMYVFDALESLT